MAGLDPAIHVLAAKEVRRGCPRHRRAEATPFFERLCAGMTKNKASGERGNTMKSTPFDLTGQVAVITGSSRGIGRSSAELLAKLGAKVVISSRKAEACQEVADGITKAGGDAHVIACNISRREEVEALITGATSHYGKID